MTADDVLAERIRPLLAGREDYSERRMFGGVCFMIGGNMCVGTWRDALIARIDRAERDSALAEPHTRPADMNGRVMKGWVMVEPAASDPTATSNRGSTAPPPMRQRCRRSEKPTIRSVAGTEDQASGGKPSSMAAWFKRRSRLANGQPSRIASAR